MLNNDGQSFGVGENGQNQKATIRALIIGIGFWGTLYKLAGGNILNL